MDSVSIQDLRLLTIDSRPAALTDFFQRFALLIFLRHLA
jgi:hypothetical protein